MLPLIAMRLPRRNALGAYNCSLGLFAQEQMDARLDERIIVGVYDMEDFNRIFKNSFRRNVDEQSCWMKSPIQSRERVFLRIKFLAPLIMQ